MKKDLALIFFENPISRCYLQVCKLRNFKFNKIIVLENKKFIPNYISRIYNFQKMNYYPLLFLKNKIYEDTTKKIADYFSYPEDFFTSSYKNDSLYNFANDIEFVNTDNINSEIFVKSLLKKKNLNYLNTGKKIYKEPLNHNLKILHIHPGYLPNIRGADASLWNMEKLNCLGATSFLMTKKIDEGSIVSKSFYNYPRIKLNNFANIEIKELYRFWFSFIDPIIRSRHFDDYILESKSEENNLFNLNKEVDDKNEYFSFMDNTNVKNIIRRVLNSD
tara:strand:- start:57 stop:884 length:828 start_codon:yes stop_codon:yes gene_type:complete